MCEQLRRSPFDDVLRAKQTDSRSVELRIDSCLSYFVSDGEDEQNSRDRLGNECQEFVVEADDLHEFIFIVCHPEVLQIFIQNLERHCGCEKIVEHTDEITSGLPSNGIQRGLAWSNSPAFAAATLISFVDVAIRKKMIKSNYQ